MVLMHSQKDKKLAPAKDATEDIHKLVKEDPNKRSGPTSQVINRSQGRRRMVRTSARTYSSSLSGKLTLNPSGKASFVNHGQRKAQRICPEDLRFYQGLIHDCFKDLPEAETHKVADCGERLVALATPKPAGARSSRLPTTSSSNTKRAMSHLPVSPRKHRRSIHPYQATIETDNDDNDGDAAPSKFYAIDDDGKITGVEKLTVRMYEMFAYYYIREFSKLGQLACRDIATIWIKSCHPKKQTRCPYKGRSRTRPDYWPSSDHWRVGLGCRHIEPAHLKKSERLYLLRHLLCYGGRFCIEKLEESTKKISVCGANHWSPAKITALNAIYRVRRKEIEFENGAYNRSLLDWLARFYADKRPQDCDTEMYPADYFPGKVKARNVLRSTDYPVVKSERAHRDSKARTSLPTAVANAGIRASGTLIDDEADVADVDRMEWEGTGKPESIAIEGVPSSISMPTAPEGCAPQVEMSMPSKMFPAQQQQTRVKSLRHQHRRLLINTPSPMLSLKQSSYAEEPLSNPKPIDCQEQTSSALSFHVASKLWTSDGLEYVRGDDVVLSPSRTDLVGYPSDMPATEIQQHIPPIRPLAPRASGFAGSSSGLAGLDSYWHAPITVPSGTGDQQYNAAPHPSWDDAPATANISFSSDFTDSSGTCFSDAGFQGVYNHTQDEAIQNQYTACLTPSFGNSTINPTYLTKASDAMGGSPTVYSQGSLLL